MRFNCLLSDIYFEDQVGKTKKRFAILRKRIKLWKIWHGIKKYLNKTSGLTDSAELEGATLLTEGQGQVGHTGSHELEESDYEDDEKEQGADGLVGHCGRPSCYEQADFK